MGDFYIYLRIVLILDGRFIDIIVFLIEDSFLVEFDNVCIMNV